MYYIADGEKLQVVDGVYGLLICLPLSGGSLKKLYGVTSLRKNYATFFLYCGVITYIMLN